VSAHKSLIRVLKGERVDPAPIWLMRQAGRYLPEYKKTRAQAGDFLSLCYTPDLAAEVTLQPIRRFGFDASILFADILLIPQAMGQTLWFAEGEGPRLDPITDKAGIEALGLEVHETLAPVYETVSILSRELPERVTLIGFAGAPWTVASYMIAGRGTADQAPAKRLAWAEPELFEILMTKLVGATTAYLIEQIKAGAEVIQLFDTWAGGLPLPLFERAVLKPTRQIVAALKAAYPDIPVIGFPRGVGTMADRFIAETGVDGLSLDSGFDLSQAAALQSKVAVQGNLDPQCLVAGGQAMTDEITRICDALKGGRHIFNLGHGIVPDTPPEHVADLIAQIRARS